MLWQRWLRRRRHEGRQGNAVRSDSCAGSDFSRAVGSGYYCEPYKWSPAKPVGMAACPAIGQEVAEFMEEVWRKHG